MTQEKMETAGEREAFERRITKTVIDALAKANDPAMWKALTYDSGPYEITKLKAGTLLVARAIFAAAQGPATERSGVANSDAIASPAAAASRMAAGEREALLETFTEWARQIARRGDVPQAIRAAATTLYSDGKRLREAQPVAQEPFPPDPSCPKPSWCAAANKCLDSCTQAVALAPSNAPYASNAIPGESFTERWRDPELAASPTPKAQAGTWVLTAPDGRTWQADSPLKACGAESRERIPAQVALARIVRGFDEDAKDK